MAETAFPDEEIHPRLSGLPIYEGVSIALASFCFGAYRLAEAEVIAAIGPPRGKVVAAIGPIRIYGADLTSVRIEVPLC